MACPLILFSLSFPRTIFAPYTAGENTPNFACDPICRLLLLVRATGFAVRALWDTTKLDPKRIWQKRLETLTWGWHNKIVPSSQQLEWHQSSLTETMNSICPRVTYLTHHLIFHQVKTAQSLEQRTLQEPQKAMRVRLSGPLLMTLWLVLRCYGGRGERDWDSFGFSRRDEFAGFDKQISRSDKKVSIVGNSRVPTKYITRIQCHVSLR